MENLKLEISKKILEFAIRKAKIHCEDTIAMGLDPLVAYSIFHLEVEFLTDQHIKRVWG